MGVELADDYFLIATEEGCQAPPHPDWLTRSWKTARRRAKVPNARFHDLRHFVSAHVVHKFGAVTAAGRVKHASAQMTDDYGHQLDEQDRLAADYIGALVHGAAPLP